MESLSAETRTTNLSPHELRLGLGLRRTHYSDILKSKTQLPHWEVITENLFSPLPADLKMFENLRAESEIFFHGVALSIGGTDPLNLDYLKKVNALAERWQPQMISDHLCWGSVGGRHFHDLYPIPYNKKSLDRVSERIHQAQNYLGRSLCLENVSSYVAWKASDRSEWEFLAELHHRTGVKYLLDVNNIHVNAVNFQFDPMKYIEALPLGSVAQFHIAGAKAGDDFLLDDHGSAPHPEVIELLRIALLRFGVDLPVTLEWDNNIPSFFELLDEVEVIRAGLSKTLPPKAFPVAFATMEGASRG